MINYEDALEILKAKADNIQAKVENVSLLEAMGRILAIDLFSPESIPAADNSAMDGFAIRSEDTRAASPECPVRIEIVGTLAAGGKHKPWKFGPRSGLEIMTGAIIPDSALDAVIRVEDVELVTKDNSTYIKVDRYVAKGSHIRARGTDFQQGQKFLSRGSLIQEQHIMALAALGISQIAVFVKLKVAVISTGSEVVSWETKNVNAAQVRNSSAPYLKVFLEKNQCRVDLLGLVKDDVTEFGVVLREVLSQNYDLIVTTGAVSAGKWDFVTSVIPNFGFKIVFHKAAIRPGKPILFAESTKQATLFFGLPGNPISTAVGAQFFILPLLKHRMQMPDDSESTLLLNDTNKPENFECFYKARMKCNEDGSRAVEVLPGQMSYMIHSFIDSNCWVQLPAHRAEMKSQSKVKTFRI